MRDSFRLCGRGGDRHFVLSVELQANRCGRRIPNLTRRVSILVSSLLEALEDCVIGKSAGCSADSSATIRSRRSIGSVGTSTEKGSARPMISTNSANRFYMVSSSRRTFIRPERPACCNE